MLSDLDDINSLRNCNIEEIDMETFKELLTNWFNSI